MAIFLMMRSREEWSGTMSELVGEVAKFRNMDDNSWPQTTKGAVAMLKRYKPTLRAACIDVHEAGREGGGGYRRALYRIKRTPEWAAQEFSSEVSVV